MRLRVIELRIELSSLELATFAPVNTSKQLPTTGRVFEIENVIVIVVTARTVTVDASFCYFCLAVKTIVLIMLLPELPGYRPKTNVSFYHSRFYCPLIGDGVKPVVMKLQFYVIPKHWRSSTALCWGCSCSSWIPSWPSFLRLLFCPGAPIRNVNCCRKQFFPFPHVVVPAIQFPLRQWNRLSAYFSVFVFSQCLWPVSSPAVSSSICRFLQT